MISYTTFEVFINIIVEVTISSTLLNRDMRTTMLVWHYNSRLLWQEEENQGDDASHEILKNIIKTDPIINNLSH